MKRINLFWKVFALLLAVIMVLMGIMPQVAQAHIIDQQNSQQYTTLNSPNQGIGIDLQALLNATIDPTDSDNDGLPDTVEWVLGTNPEYYDSDFDTLDDYYEAANSLDPLKADSNNDGLVDNLEIKDVALDFDNDGIPNVWDEDNDNDSVRDNLDRSPFAKSTIRDDFKFNIQTNGNPTYLDFQIIPENTDHLKLPMVTWDWPDDTEGQMQDRDGSLDDVQVYPMLELTLSSRPEKSDVEDYGIGVPQEEDTEGFVTRGITIEDIDGNGDPDLFLFGGDAATDPDRPGYIIGWDSVESDFLISPSRWSPIKGLPYPGKDYLGSGAFTDLNSNGMPEIYVPHIYSEIQVHPTLYFLYGIDLDTHGDSSSELKDISWWEFIDNNLYYPYLYSAGSGLGIADINGNGRPDLLATYIIEGTNELAYLIGWDLYSINDPSGYPYGTASDWSCSPLLWLYGPLHPTLPDLPSIPAFGGGVTSISVKIADINGNGVLDWILMGTDIGANQLHYMIGWDLNTGGVPTSWSEIKTSPQIGSSVAGGGALATDLNGNGMLDLLLLAVDNAEKHVYHYTVGWDIDTSGNPASWSQLYKQGTDLNNIVYVPLTPFVDFGTNVAFSGRMFLPAGLDEDISIEARLVWTVTGINDDQDGNSVTTRLATYREDFMITGFAVTENYGIDGGLFYSNNRDQTIAAGFVLAYEFLRAQTSLGDIPDKMVEYGISNQSHPLHSPKLSYPHQDAALVGLTSEMIEDALELLPDGQILPILLAMEDHCTSIELSELNLGNDETFLNVDLRAIPITTAKMFRINWYNTTTNEPVFDEIITEMQQWGLEDDVLENVTRTILAWMAGEYTITRIGEEEVLFIKPEQSQVLDTIGSVFDYGLTGIDITRATYGIYRYFTKIPKVSTGAGLKGFFSAAFGACKEIQAVRVGKIGKINSAIKWVNIVGELLAVGVAFYVFFDVAISSGWSTEGVALGVLYMDAYLAYGLIITIVATIPVIGWAAALAIVISDAIGGWFTDFTDWFVGLFYEIDIITQVNIEVEDSSFSFDDYDGNGLDVGDRVELIADIVEKAWNTGSAPAGSVWFYDSYINVSLQCDDGNTSDQDTDRFIIGSEVGSDYINYTYENYFWAEPNQAMINFPWNIWINYNYKIYYEWETMGEQGIWYKTGSGIGAPFTIYLDVLPGNFDNFLTWDEITCLDPDGDGVQTNSGEDPNPDIYDTDGDGLSDGFEFLLSLNPSNGDSDGDGLSDLTELRLGTDPLIADTDGDGLSDSEEYNGWDITFTYGAQTTAALAEKTTSIVSSGQQFVAHVFSDPLVVDTDGDGVSDYDEYIGPLWDCSQGNPRSQDTNGNGIKDRLNIVPVIYIDSEAEVYEGETLTLSGYFTDPDPDTWTATVDYGDGTGVQPLNLNPDKTFSLNHTYTDNNIYTANITISDGSYSVSSTSIIITVVNVPPTVDAGDDLEIFLGQVFILDVSLSDPGINDNPWQFTVDCGDNSPQVTGVSDIQGGNIVLATHHYSVLGVYAVTITVKDKDGGIGTDTLQVEVNKLQVKIDIKPGSETNPINLKSNGVIPVAILTDNEFDASTVDFDTVGFGPNEAAPVRYAMEDVDGDGDTDMILHFRTQEVGLAEQDTEAVLLGQTVEGIYIIGKDTVRIVPPKDKPVPPGKDDAPGQNKEPGDSATGKAKGKDDAPGQNKEPGDSATGKAKGKDKTPG